MFINDVKGKIIYYLAILFQNMAEQATHDYSVFHFIRESLYPYIGECRNKTILDIGCGRRYANTLLFAAYGNDVTGIDLEYVGYKKPFWLRYWYELKINGFQSFGRALTQDLFGQRQKYYRKLSILCGKSFDNISLDVKRMSVENMKFSDEYFDTVISNACFEHVADVSKAVKEIQRTLKKGGVAYIDIHLFTSPSGGHHSNQALKNIPPWDHLRGNSYQAPVFLNKLRKADYLRLFSSRLEILKTIDVPEKSAEQLLTPEIRLELAEYNKDELLTRGLIIIARKR
jgi:SAM-dependent methyltransferase